MTLQEFCNSLSKDKQLELGIRLTKIALPIWDKYAESNTLSYRDSIVGLRHNVSKRLLADTVREIEKYVSTQGTDKRREEKAKFIKVYTCFEDPVIALEDDDWILPNPVEKTFYAVYNLLGSIIENDKTAYDGSRTYVAINQAIKAIETEKILSEHQIRKILENAKNNRGQRI